MCKVCKANKRLILKINVCLVLVFVLLFILLFIFVNREKQHKVKLLSKTDDVSKSSDVITIDSDDDDVDKLTSEEIEKISKHFKPGKNMCVCFFVKFIMYH